MEDYLKHFAATHEDVNSINSSSVGKLNSFNQLYQDLHYHDMNRSYGGISDNDIDYDGGAMMDSLKQWWYGSEGETGAKEQLKHGLGQTKSAVYAVAAKSGELGHKIMTNPEVRLAFDKAIEMLAGATREGIKLSTTMIFDIASQVALAKLTGDKRPPAKLVKGIAKKQAIDLLTPEQTAIVQGGYIHNLYNINDKHHKKFKKRNNKYQSRRGGSRSRRSSVKAKRSNKVNSKGIKLRSSQSKKRSNKRKSSSRSRRSSITSKRNSRKCSNKHNSNTNTKRRSKKRSTKRRKSKKSYANTRRSSKCKTSTSKRRSKRYCSKKKSRSSARRRPSLKYSNIRGKQLGFSADDMLIYNP